MWKLLQTPYFITSTVEAELYFIGVTDFRRYWITNATTKTFLADLKESNDGLEFDDEKELLQRGLDMIAKPESLKNINIKFEEDKKFLLISMTKMYEIILKLELGLLEASVEHFFNAIIQPLLKTVCDLRQSQSELRALLIKKDKEIEEYKIEGKAPRRLITTVYDDATHMMKHTTYEEYFCAPKVPEQLESIASCTNNKRKHSPAPTIETEDIKIKKRSQENGTDASVNTEITETEAKSDIIENKSRKQKKRLNY